MTEAAAAAIDRWLEDCGFATRVERSRDLNLFASHLGLERTVAVGQLLAAGRAGAAELVSAWVRVMQGDELAHATIKRRLSSLRTLVRSAHFANAIDWELDTSAIVLLGSDCGRRKKGVRPRIIIEIWPRPWDCLRPEASFMAQVAARSELRGIGRTQDEAIGNLIRHHAARLGIEVVSPEPANEKGVALE